MSSAVLFIQKETGWFCSLPCGEGDRVDQTTVQASNRGLAVRSTDWFRVDSPAASLVRRRRVLRRGEIPTTKVAGTAVPETIEKSVHDRYS